MARAGARAVRVGFVPLIDAAPLIAAHELGYFAEEGLAVTLHRQIGWGNVRDKLTFGQLDASHALVGMPLASRVGGPAFRWFTEPLVAVMTLCTGGNAITVSRRLADQGVNSGATLAQWVRGRRAAVDDRPPRFAHVFNCSTHHFLLREWLSAAGLDPDADVRLCVVPPAQMGRQLADGALDGFCAGEPWNTIAQRTGTGRIVIPTTDVIPDHPEKVLAVTRGWLDAHTDAAERLVRATVRACMFCQAAGNRPALARMLAGPVYLDLPVDAVHESLSQASLAGIGPGARLVRDAGWSARSFAAGNTRPNPTHVAWLLERMIRAGHADANTDVRRTALDCCDPTAHRAAAGSLGLTVDGEDFPPMRLRHGQVYRVEPPPPSPSRPGPGQSATGVELAVTAAG